MPSGRAEVAAVAAVIAAAFVIRSLRRGSGDNKDGRVVDANELKTYLRRRLSSSMYDSKLAEEMLRASERAGEEWQSQPIFEEEPSRMVLEESGLAALEEEESRKVSRLLLTLTVARPDLEPLRKFKNLQVLAIESTLPLTTDALAVLRSLTDLKILDLQRCRVCIDDNNTSTEHCSALAIFRFARMARHLRELRLPDWYSLRVGTVVRCFGRASVAIISLTHSLCVGDTVQMRRVSQDLTGDQPHEWRGEPCEVTSIRDQHSHNLHEAKPSPRDSEFSVGLRELGKKNDAVYWTGIKIPHCAMH